MSNGVIGAGCEFRLEMHCFGQEILDFSSVRRGGVAKLGLPSWVALMVSVVLLDPAYVDVGSLLSVVALVLGGRSYCAVVD